jgi:hypothetical protein
VSLIDTERDDEAVLRAEDEAIAAADAEEAPPTIPTASLIEDIFNGTAPPLQRETEG